MRHTASARRHNISKARREQVIRNAERVVHAGYSPHTGRPVHMVIGRDDDGAELEVGVVYENGRIVIVHAMELREKYR